MKHAFIVLLFVLVLAACSSKKGDPEPDSTVKITLTTPADGNTISSGGDHVFSWSAAIPNNSATIPYKVRIVEIVGDQSPENALRTNKPIFEKDSCCFITATTNTYSPTALRLIGGKKYAWKVLTRPTAAKPKIDSSAVSMFKTAAGGAAGGSGTTKTDVN